MKTSSFIVLSPCVRQCTLNEQDVCVGCFRTLEEICNWKNINDEEKKAVLKKIQDRKQNTIKKA